MSARFFKFLMGAMALITIAGCVPEDEVEDYPIINDLSNTVWENTTEDKSSGYFYRHFMEFRADDTGTLKGYKADDLNTPLSEVGFTYEYPLNDRYGLSIRFEDGGRYDGYLVQKGNLQVDYKDVYVIQLFEVDENGQTIFDENGNPASTMLFWKE